MKIEVIKIYKVTCTESVMMDEQGTGFSLKPWGNDTDHYKGYNDEGKEYILPEGFELAECQDKSMQIYEGSYHCPLINHRGFPALVTSKGVMILKRVNVRNVKDVKTKII